MPSGQLQHALAAHAWTPAALARHARAPHRLHFHAPAAASPAAAAAKTQRRPAASHAVPYLSGIAAGSAAVPMDARTRAQPRDSAAAWGAQPMPPAAAAAAAAAAPAAARALVPLRHLLSPSQPAAKAHVAATAAVEYGAATSSTSAWQPATAPRMASAAARQLPLPLAPCASRAPQRSAAAAAAAAAAAQGSAARGRQRVLPGTARGAASASTSTPLACGAGAAAGNTPWARGVATAAAPGGGGGAGAAAAAAPPMSEAEEAAAAAADAAQEEARRAAEERRRRFVGQLQGVPHVVGAAEALASARKKAARVVPSAGVKNAAERERNRAARRLDALMQALAVPLGRYVSAFPPPEALHPFERQLLGLTVGGGEGAYVAALARVEGLRKAVQEVGKGAAARAAAAPSRAAAVALGDEGAEAVEAVYTAGARHVDALRDIAKSLRSLPSLDAAAPTLALVGAPNVGKSSLVNVLSSGTPEVCNYPFTTRSIKMGHFYLDAVQHQVTDTPGLLRRPDAARNRMERLTLAALACLDAAVLFVTDLTAECGTSVGDQWAVRCEVRARFPDRPWLDVFSKADMLQDVFAAADQLAATQPPPPPPQPAAGPNTPAAAAAAAVDAAASQPPPAEAGEAGEQEQEQAQEQAEEEALGAVEVAARLPAALRVSCLTHDGIPQLQLAIIRTLRARAAQRAAERAAAKQAAQLHQVAQGGAGGASGQQGRAGQRGPGTGLGQGQGPAGPPQVLTLFKV